MTPRPYPLDWPDGWARTPATDRRPARSPDGVGPKTAREAFRRLSRDNHPDRGGNTERMAEITRAYKEFQDT